MTKEITNRVSGNISNHHRDALLKIVFERKIPLARLIAIAIDKELMREDAFEICTTLPRDKTIEYAYAEQASKILSFMKDINGIGIDQLILLRHDVGIPDVTELLYGLKECIDKGFVESFKPKPSPYVKIEYAEGYLHYRLTENNPIRRKRREQKGKRYEKLQKLKKEFKE